MFCGKHISFKLQGIQVAIVGANQWKGGYLQYTSRGTKDGSYEPVSMEPDSYLGKDMTVIKLTHIDVIMRCSTAILPHICFETHESVWKRDRKNGNEE